MRNSAITDTDGTGGTTAGEPDRRAARGQRAWAVLCALLGLLSLGGAVGLGATLPDRIDTERAYLGAVPCGTAGEPDAGADCLRTLRGTVESAEEVRRGKTRVVRVRLRAPAPAPLDTPLDLSTTSDLARALDPGDELEVTVWRDVRVSVHHGGLGDDADALPDGEVGPVAGLVAACAWLAAVAFTGAYGGERRARRMARGRFHRPRVGFGPARTAGVLAVPFLIGVVVGRIWEGWTTVLVTAGVSTLVAVQATVFALHADRPPAPPAGPVT
ncbi:hypothetical protein ACFVU3_29860 [Streptomyces sp. NPDC058052]|uniref:hypothetical protein n=1 Tax=Streptomyces sp. NPDC058052 TaxID=3346316 RepID=UPI0036E8FDDC